MVADIGQYEVQQGERFAHMTEPMVSFARSEVWINMGCLKRMPDTVYVHFLLFRQSRRLVIKPGLEEHQNGVRWCTPSGKPRRIICAADFWDDITSLMGWNENNRYRLLGRFANDSGGGQFAFDMTRAEVFPLAGIARPSELAADTNSLTNQTWEEYCKNPLVRRFEEDTLIVIDEGG